jgi:hypothetical protein
VDFWIYSPFFGVLNSPWQPGNTKKHLKTQHQVQVRLCKHAGRLAHFQNMTPELRYFPVPFFGAGATKKSMKRAKKEALAIHPQGT